MNNNRLKGLLLEGDRKRKPIISTSEKQKWI
jgi:hypothetical protein